MCIVFFHDPDEAADLPGRSRLHMVVPRLRASIVYVHADRLPGSSEVAICLSSESTRYRKCLNRMLRVLYLCTVCGTSDKTLA